MNIYTKNKNLALRDISLGIVATLVFVGFVSVFQLPIRNSVYFISSPETKFLKEAGRNTLAFFESYFNGKGLKQENSNIKEENQNLLSHISLLQESLRQNQAGTESQEVAKANNFNVVLAGVVGLNVGDDSLLINKGLDDGISQNMPLISAQKVVYGKVLKVYKNFSEVLLISSKNSVVDVKVQRADVTQTPVYGAVKGSGNLSVYLDLVNSNSKLNENDVLVTSGLEGIFPKDLLVGKITSVSQNDLKPFQTAKVQPFYDVQNIDHLLVITNYLKK